jgi:glycosyltransferase involved in cell wall biosynthesis
MFLDFAIGCTCNRNVLIGETVKLIVTEKAYRISVVVPTFKRPDLLHQCLRALTMQDLDPTDYEIIVVDDAACETTRRQVDDWIECMHRGKSEDCPVHTIRYIAITGSHGPAIARNVGWRAANGEIIAFTDDDCIPTPGWLSAGLAAFTDGIVGISGKLIMPLMHIPTDYERDAVQLEKSEFVTANCFYRRDMLERVGGFDERFIAAWREDSDLFFTLQEYVEKCRGVQDDGLRDRDGGRPQGSPLHIFTALAPTDGGCGHGRRPDPLPAFVYVPRAVVIHPIRSASWGISIKQQRKSMYNALLYKKHPALYRQNIQATPPWHYYCILAALLVALVSMVAGFWLFALGALTVWMIMTGRFCLQRLYQTSHAPSHVMEMIVTSILIPPLSIFWRIVGAIRFRVFFL